jgi:hypothetical protein
MFDTFNSRLTLKRNKKQQEDVQNTANSALDDHDESQDSPKPKYLYHGHRRASWTTDDIDELTELRARRRSPLEKGRASHE